MNFSLPQIEQIVDTALNKHGLNQVYQTFCNCLMKLERNEFLRLASDMNNKGNGYRAGSASGVWGSLSLRIPRDRLGHFYPVILSVLRNQENELHELAFNLYSKGLSTRDVSDVFESIYGKNYSKSSISRITQSFSEELQQWRDRLLQRRYPVLIVDALFTHIRRAGKVESEAIYTVIGLQEDMSRDILAIENIPQESASGWASLLQNLKARGLETTDLIIADGINGLENSIARVYPEADLQKCVVHLKRNILNHVRHDHKEEVAADLREVFNISDPTFSREEASDRFETFCVKWGSKYPYIKRLKNRHEMTYYFTYLQYDYRIRGMIYTTNWVERLHKSFRRVLKIRNSMPTEESALLLLSKVAMDKSDRYRKYPIYNFKFDTKLFPNKY